MKTLLYKLKFYVQVFLWCVGYSIHLNDECVLDFGCCYNNLKTKSFAHRLKLVANRIKYGYWKTPKNGYYRTWTKWVKR